MVDDQQYMNVVPPALRDVGVLTEPLTIAEKALEQVWQVQKRLPWGPVPDQNDAYEHRAVVLGAGPVGILGAMALIAAGFKTYVYSREAKPNPKADVVEAIGAEYVSSSTVSVDDLAKQVGHIDLVYEAVGASNLAFDVLRVLATNGVFVFTGVPGRKAPIEVDTDLIMRDLVLKNQVAFGTVNAGRNAFEDSIRDLGKFMEKWPDAVRSLITRHPIGDFHDLMMGQSSGIKNVITLDS